MEIRKKKVFEDREGVKEEVEFVGGIKRTSILKPSDWYIENVLEPLKEERKIQEADIEYKKKIGAKLREMAEKELEKEKI